jgi:hypothetical protein
MAHWAEIDENNIVIRVTVGDNNDPDEGYQWLIDNVGGTWIKTSYNAATNGFRKNYAGIGYTWDESRDAFIPPQIFPSWTLDENTCNWVCPKPYPETGEIYGWNEDLLEWVNV